MAKHNNRPAFTATLPKQSLKDLSSTNSPAPWVSLSPSTGDAVAMVEAFLEQDEQSNPSASSATAVPPEQEDDVHPRTAMPLGKFVPIRGADYTESFISRLQDELRKKGEASFRQVPLWLSCLGLPSRQRLIFRDEFIARRNTVQINFHNYRRAMQIYRVGAAQRVPCNECQRGMGPFRKCVVDADGDALKGACANCAFREHGHICGYHQKFRDQPTIARENIASSTSAKTRSRRPEPDPTTSNVKRQRPVNAQNGSVPQTPNTSSKGSKQSKAAGTASTISPRKTKRQKSSSNMPNAASETIITSDVVFRNTTFSAGQASREQVQYILKHCNGEQRAFFTGAWLSWCAERGALGRPQSFNDIEVFLSVGWHEDLNEVISKVCPAGPSQRYCDESLGKS